MKPEVSIIMPCLNEERTVGICIKKAKAWLSQNNINGEILIGDNNSTDNSKSIAKKLGATVVDVYEPGFGAAIYYTTLKAKGKYLIIGDADDSYDFSNLNLFIDKMREGYDIVTGNRFIGGIEKGAMPWANRYIGNPLLSYFGRMLFCLPISDMHCGLRALNNNVIKSFEITQTNMTFITELLIKSKINNLKITEVPTKLHKDGRNRKPHLRPWRDGLLNLKLMLFMYFFKHKYINAKNAT